MNATITTGRTKVENGIQYSEVMDMDIHGRTSAQWTRTSNLTMTLNEAERIIAQADIEQLEADLKDELASDYAQDEDNQRDIATIRTKIADLKAKLA